jgi:hypothetical protein
MSEINKLIKIEFVIEVYNKNSRLDESFFHNGHEPVLYILLKLNYQIKMEGGIVAYTSLIYGTKCRSDEGNSSVSQWALAVV